MTVPDAAIEAAAEALLVGMWVKADSRSDLTIAVHVAIKAAMPAIREAIAQEIEADEAEPNYDSGDYCSDFGIGWDKGMDHAARIVRGGTP